MNAMSVAPAACLALPRETILRLARFLPADLGILAQLGDMLQDANSDLDAIAALLRRDVALAARIVRVSNGPVFGGVGRIASVEEAVNRVGFGEILKLVGTASAARFSQRSLENYGISARKLRDNMLYGALAGEALALVAGADARVAYTAGLLRPLGMMVLNQAARELGGPAPHYIPTQWSGYSAWEESVFGIDHCAVCALVLDEWRFPLEIGEAIRDHRMTRREDFADPLAALLNVANGMAHRVSRSFSGESQWWDLTDEKLRAAGLTANDFEPAIVWTESAFEAAVAAMAV